MSTVNTAKREPAIKVEPRPALKVGDKVNLASSKRAWTVRGVTDRGRFVILTQPFNVRRTVLYTVIDFDRGIRGRDNYYGLGYESDADVAAALHDFQHTESGTGQCPENTFDVDKWCHGGAEVSFRSGNHVRLDITRINGEPTDHWGHVLSGDPS